ncbi:MAG: transposase [Candidatus Lokiarchaeota archaeon]|nr:transposase [Candidatus Lokiarchaeota archaeon]
MQTKKTSPRAIRIKPNENICFPIGTVIALKEFFHTLELENIFRKHKQKGRDLSSLTKALVSYKLTENLSISKASKWINRSPILELFELVSFEDKTLYRALDIIGENREEIMFDVQSCLFNRFDFEHTDVNIDWSSLILWGKRTKIGKRGYSRDHRPDKKQLTFGVTELSHPINIPIGLTVQPGNIHDSDHFLHTFDQVKNWLKPGSRIVMDKGAYSKENLDYIRFHSMRFLTAKKLNKSHDKLIKKFDLARTELVNEKDSVYGIKLEWPSRTDYFYFSEKLEHEQLESKIRKAEKLFLQAKDMQDIIDNNKKIPKRYQINNPLVDAKIVFQTKLTELTDDEALELAKKAAINGREGFFCLTSSDNLTLKEALETYRMKDSILTLRDVV